MVAMLDANLLAGKTCRAVVWQGNAELCVGHVFSATFAVLTGWGGAAGGGKETGAKHWGALHAVCQVGVTRGVVGPDLSADNECSQLCF